MEALVLVSIFLAIALSIIGFIMLLKYRGFGNDKIELLDQKLNSVNNALDSCEKMIDELNRLSDYIISNVEEKSLELKELVENADKKISSAKIKPQPHFEVRLDPETIVAAESVETKTAAKTSERSKKSTTKSVSKSTEKDTEKTTAKTPRKKKAVPEENIVTTPKIAADAYKANSPAKEKKSKYVVDTVIVDNKDNEKENGKMYAFLVNSKVKDVIELSKQGLEPTEIAKKLRIGLGEIELILGIKK